MNLPKIKVSGFEGPFDLLLHLIKQNKMDIYDIKIYDITNQYLDYINKMKELDLEITSEFIVIAATLIEIKSKMLLPKKEKELTEEEEEDLKEKLLEKLIEYKKIKLASSYLNKLMQYTGEVYTKRPEIIDDSNLDSNKNKDNLFNNITMIYLFDLFNKLINNYLMKQNQSNNIERKIPVDKYTIKDKMNEIINTLDNSKQVINFLDLTKKAESKIEVVVTFLALLELVKVKAINVIQNTNFETIYIERVLSKNG